MSETKILKPDAEGIKTASELLKAGELVAFPTETVYGLGADGTQGQAVAAIFEAKGRPSFNPLIIHVATLDQALELVDLPEPLLKLAKTFWPGPLTLVAPLKPEHPVSDLVSAGLPTLAVRVPNNPIAQALLKSFDGPVAAPSANPSGRISPTRADHVVQGLTGKVAAILDGGACPVGLESTILGMSLKGPVVLRPGGLAIEDIEGVWGHKIPDNQSSSIKAPGQLTSHYAPNAPIRLNQKTALDGEAYLAFGNGEDRRYALDLSPSGDLREAAANLFSHLRDLDALAKTAQLSRISVAPIPNINLGVAINDRLKRAAAPRR